MRSACARSSRARSPNSCSLPQGRLLCRPYKLLLPDGLTAVFRIMGCDVSSTEIVMACANANQAVKTVANNRKAITAWLKQLPTDAVIGMEATGRYHDVLAGLAARRGHRVCVINPKHLSL